MSVDIMPLEGVVAHYAEAEGWDQLERDDTLLLAAEARAHFAHLRRQPMLGRKAARVYVIRDPRGYVKVGVSNDPEARAHDLSAGNPTPVKVIYQTAPYDRSYAMAVEAAAHDFLAGALVHREWFDCDFDRAIQAIHLMGGSGDA